MGLFSRIPEFNLEVYNEYLGLQIQSDDKKYFTVVFSPSREQREGLLIGMPDTGGMGKLGFFKADAFKTADMLVKNGYINSEWKRFAVYWYNLRMNNNYLFKKIENKYLPLVRQYGNDRANLTDEYDEPEFREQNLPKSEVIWATEFLQKVREYRQYDYPHTIVIFYRNFFKHIEGSDYSVWAWQRINRSTKFIDTVAGIIVISYLYRN